MSFLSFHFLVGSSILCVCALLLMLFCCISESSFLFSFTLVPRLLHVSMRFVHSSGLFLSRVSCLLHFDFPLTGPSARISLFVFWTFCEDFFVCVRLRVVFMTCGFSTINIFQEADAWS
jgi:hypothetical protein